VNKPYTQEYLWELLIQFNIKNIQYYIFIYNTLSKKIHKDSIDEFFDKLEWEEW